MYARSPWYHAVHLNCGKHLLDLDFHFAGFVIFKHFTVVYALQHKSRVAHSQSVVLTRT